MLPAGSDVTFAHVSAGDGEELQAGTMRLRVLHTPGHTHHHVSYALADQTGSVRAVFTGGSMLYGATGRTDLVSPADTNELTDAQYHSVQRLARELPAEGVFPTHGFGSFCSATPTNGTASTVGEQQRVNPALTLAEQEYVDTLLAGLDAYPAYYLHMAPINRSGPPPVDLSTPERVDPAELRRRIEAGEWVVDLRDRRAFAAGHGITEPGTAAKASGMEAPARCAWRSLPSGPSGQLQRGQGRRNSAPIGRCLGRCLGVRRGG